MFVIFLPLATAALAATISGASVISNQQNIRRTNWKLRSRDLLMKHCAGDAERSISETEFLGAVLVDLGVIDDETLQVVARKFREVVGDDPLHQTIDAEVVYEHLRDASQVLDVDDRQGYSHDGKEILPHVNLCSMDRGFEEWYFKYWLPQVRREASQPGSSKRDSREGVLVKNGSCEPDSPVGARRLARRSSCRRSSSAPRSGSSGCKDASCRAEDQERLIPNGTTHSDSPIAASYSTPAPKKKPQPSIFSEEELRTLYSEPKPASPPSRQMLASSPTARSPRNNQTQSGGDNVRAQLEMVCAHAPS